MTVIVFNGNAGNRAFRAPLAAALAEHGISVLLFDYRGYGGNPGSPSEEGLAADARAARRYVAGRAGSDRIVYFGESLGSGVAVRLAAEQPPAALILRSPFTSLTDTGRHHYPFLPVGMMLIDRFASIDRIRDIRCPLLVIAADHDSVVPTATEPSPLRGGARAETAGDHRSDGSQRLRAAGGTARRDDGSRVSQGRIGESAPVLNVEC